MWLATFQDDSLEWVHPLPTSPSPVMHIHQRANSFHGSGPFYLFSSLPLGKCELYPPYLKATELTQVIYAVMIWEAGIYHPFLNTRHTRLCPQGIQFKNQYKHCSSLPDSITLYRSECIFKDFESDGGSGRWWGESFKKWSILHCAVTIGWTQETVSAAKLGFVRLHQTLAWYIYFSNKRLLGLEVHLEDSPYVGKLLGFAGASRDINHPCITIVQPIRSWWPKNWALKQDWLGPALTSAMNTSGSFSP